MTFELDLYPQGNLAVTLPISWIIFINMHKYNPWGDDHFQVNRSKDKVARAIRIFAVGARGIMVDRDLQFLVQPNALLTGTCYRVKTPAYFL